jgi:hypothetical protein
MDHTNGTPALMLRVLRSAAELLGDRLPHARAAGKRIVLGVRQVLALHAHHAQHGSAVGSWAALVGKLEDGARRSVESLTK